MSVAISNEPAQLDGERQRLADALALAERDRQLLGYEIHDGLVQDLTAAAMLLEGAERQANFASDEARDSFKRALRLLRASIAEARRVIREATTLPLESGDLASKLRQLVERFRVDHGLAITLDCEDAGPALPAFTQHLLLRIVQESLFNIWKHARANQVNVRLAQNGEALELAIADNGVGFDASRVPAGHFGLEGIRARARILRAALNIDSEPGRGARITVQMPLPA